MKQFSIKNSSHFVNVKKNQMVFPTSKHKKNKIKVNFHLTNAPYSTS